MAFKLKLNQLTQLFNPDSIHRGVSLDKLKRLGKIIALESLLKTNFQKGLLNDRNQHIQRRAYYGSNWANTQKKRSFLALVYKNLEDELIRIMIAAGMISLVLGVLTQGLKWGWIEGFSILFAVMVVVFFSSINDLAHEKSFQLMKGKTQNRLTRVYRSGKLYLLDYGELMVGDIVQIMAQDIANADGVLISGDDLLVDQSEITGQPVQVKKRLPTTYDRYEGSDPFILSGSRIMSGMAIMLVLAVGNNSYYGSITAKMHEQHIDAPLKLKISALSDEMNDIGQVVGIITFTSLLLHYIYWCFQDQNPISSLLSSQTIHKLVEAILITFTIDVALPESLPLLITIALTVTAKQLQKQDIFVKHLNQCETMGSIDNLCLSKTGFISKNLLLVSEIFIQERITNIISHEIMSESTCNILNLAIVMNSVASPKFIEENGTTLRIQHIGNKTQSALLEMTYRMGYNYQRFRINSKVKRIYSSALPKKKMATVYKDESGKLYLFVKGSPKFLLSYCTYHINRYEQIEKIGPETRLKIQSALEHFAKSNQKIVIIAFKQVNSVPSKWSQVQKNLVLIAMIGIKDTIRKNVDKTIKQCENLGVTVRMLSNQNRNNAIGAARQSGLLSQDWVENGRDYTVIEGSDFRQLVSALAKQDKQNQDRKLAVQNFKLIKESLKLIYRASAEDKLLLTIGLKQCGHTVAVAGNGTNDTEALRKADVSISMGLTCNQTAKQASDIVVLDDNFTSILKTILWGRHTMNTIKKFLALQLTINLVAAVMALEGAVFVGQSPLNPLQMLWINLVIDVIGSVTLILEPPLVKQLNKQPYSRGDKLVTIEMVKLIIIQSFIQVIILSWIMFYAPEELGLVSSVGVQEWNQETGKHYSLFFHTFVMLQIFNEFNVRKLSFDKLNIFQGFYDNPLFLCLTLFSFILQFSIVKYGNSMLHITELSFKENMLCFLFASLSIFGNTVLKIIIPKHIKLTKSRLQLGNYRYVWGKQKEQQINIIQRQINNNFPLSQAELEALSPQFSVFLTKRRTKYNFSYLQPKDTIRDSFNFEQESLTQQSEDDKFR